MSGHSKWSTIKHKKGVTDARRGQLFTKLTKEVIVAARQGGSDPVTNLRLRMAIQRAKDNNVPNGNIERAIKRSTGDALGQDQMDEVVYEGYGPGGTAILLQVVTDNRNRTVSDVRSTFTRAGASLAAAGAVTWQFEQKGVIVADVTEQESDNIALAAIDAGAEDFDAYDSTLEIYSDPQRLEGICQILVKQGAEIKSSELSMVPKNTVLLDDKTAESTLRLLDQLEDLDDVQRVFSNADFSDSVLESYQKKN